MKSTRSSNLELFRIICMMGITLQHMMMHTNALESSDMYIRLWAQFFNIFAKAGVNGFVMITAWFIGTKPFHYKKIWSLYKNIWWYSIVLGTCGVIIAPELVSMYRIAATVLPISFDHWWFVTAFIGMLAFAPFLNIAIERFTERQYFCLVITGLILFSIIPTFTSGTPYLSNIAWFIYLYLLINYLKKYGMRYDIFKLLENNIVWIGMFFMIFASTVAFTILEKAMPTIREGTNFFTGMYILTEVIASLSMFLCFKNNRIGSNPIINWMGKRTFPVYLIQSNVFITVILWQGVSNLKLQDSIFFPVGVIFVSVVILIGFMLVSVPIEWVESFIWKRKPFRILDKKAEEICGNLDLIFEKERGTNQ